MTPPPVRLRSLPSPARAFAAVQAELSSLPARAVVPACLDLRYAARMAMAAARRLEALYPRLASLPGFDMERVQQLWTYAAAALHAHALEGPVRVHGFVLGRSQLDRLDRLDRPDLAGATLPADDVRARIYTLLVATYDHCRRGVTFLRWGRRDLQWFLPPLFPPRSSLLLEAAAPPIDPWPSLASGRPARPPSLVDTVTAL